MMLIRSSLHVLLVIVSFWGHAQVNKDKDQLWLGYSIDFADLQEVTHVYEMRDSARSKVGSMIFGWQFKEGMLVARDTSQFDDGSVYETAEFTFDTTVFEMKKYDMKMQIGSTTLALDLQIEEGKILGKRILTQDSITKIAHLDSAYGYKVFREEIYMLLHTIDFGPNDTLNFHSFLATGLTTVNTTIYSLGKEQVIVPVGSFDCDVLWLKGGPGMPTNKIWITRKKPRKIVRFYVPGPELSLELKRSFRSHFR